jgi:hypothetical protein
MQTHAVQATGYAILFAALFELSGSGVAGAQQTSHSRVEAALTNIMTLPRAGQDGLATIWDGNKYVQCRRMRDRTIRCESAGTLMQPSLGRVLRPERIVRLSTLGWHLDPSFGNYVRSFPAGSSATEIADRILRVLKQGYDANLTELEIRTDWVKSMPCPPRNGPTQNLAGMISNYPAMAATAVRGCAYSPTPDLASSAPIRTKTELVNIYRKRITREIQRLRVNLDRQVFVVVDTGGGYVQCQPNPWPPMFYCEVQSAESWPVLSRILTPDRVAMLHLAGYADPGRSPNYSRAYAADKYSDAALADEVLTILYDVYGYDGLPRLKFKTEEAED